MAGSDATIGVYVFPHSPASRAAFSEGRINLMSENGERPVCPWGKVDHDFESGTLLPGGSNA